MLGFTNWPVNPMKRMLQATSFFPLFLIYPPPQKATPACCSALRRASTVLSECVDECVEDTLRSSHERSGVCFGGFRPSKRVEEARASARRGSTILCSMLIELICLAKKRSILNMYSMRLRRMGLSCKVFIINEDDTVRRIPYALYERLVKGETVARSPEYAV